MNTTNERPTPETDAIQAQEWKPNWAALARRLERERDEAREDAQAQARLLGMSSEREAKLLAQLAAKRALADIGELEREQNGAGPPEANLTKTMNERPTPETDEAQWGTGKVTTAFARRLERERDEARAIAKYWQEQYGHSNPEHQWQALPWAMEGGAQ